MERQVGRVVEWSTQQGYQPHEVVKEVGSGLNGNRRRLRRLVADHTVGTIVVEHRERLTRFGFEYVEAALAGRGARILVMAEGELEDDLVRDVTEVMTSLCARLYGRRGRADAGAWHIPDAHFRLQGCGPFGWGCDVGSLWGAVPPGAAPAVRGFCRWSVCHLSEGVSNCSSEYDII